MAPFTTLGLTCCSLEMDTCACGIAGSVPGLHIPRMDLAGLLAQQVAEAAKPRQDTASLQSLAPRSR